MPRRPVSVETSDDDSIDVEEWNREDASELERPADLAKYRIVVSSRDWTVETIVRQVEHGNVDLDPAFQRRHAWRDNRRSRLIESFIMGFPVPQIVLAESPRKQGTFIVIDGKQRLMTIAGLYLPPYRPYWSQPRLTGLQVLEDYNGVTLDDFLSDAEYSSARRQLGNADIRTTVITGFRDEGVLYDIFYRINTGSVPLSSQELRQTLNRGDFARYLLQATSTPNAIWPVLDVTAPDPRLRDVELLLRLVAWRRFSRDYKGNLKPFLDDTMRRLNNAWPTARPDIERLVGQLFRGVETTRKVFGEHAGRKLKNGVYERSLNRAVFEVQAYYFSFPEVRKAAIAHSKNLKAAFADLSKDTAFVGSIEATTKSIENYRVRFAKFRAMLEKSLSLKLAELPLSTAKR